MMTTKITFTLPATNIIGAAGCVLVGEFNDWNVEEGICLQMQADGSMKAEVELAAGRDYQYRYLLSNGHWVNDDGEKVMADIFGYPVENCIIRVAEINVAASHEKATPVNSKTAKPKKVAAIKPVIVKEDLTKVEGIGKKIEALLYKNKINSYRQLSNATIKTLKEILEAAGTKYSMHNPGTWPKQAKLAAAGKWEELELMQQQLKGGK